MGDRSAIEWTDATWNPVTGCSKVSPGCAHCYIERTPPFRIAGRRFERVGNAETTGVQLHPDRLDQPLRWRKPRRVFVCSMSDLFHGAVPDYLIREVFAVMAAASQHTFQVLTKRPVRARDLVADHNALVLAARQAALRGLPIFQNWPLPNVWLGVSVENARHTWRADVLRQIPAAVRFISAEPLLGSLFDDGPLMPTQEPAAWRKTPRRRALDLSGIDWTIAGAESGPHARPMDEAWARELRDACQAAGVAFFYKQAAVNGKKIPLPRLDGRQWTEFPR